MVSPRGSAGKCLAQYSLGLAYEKGQGVPQDYQEAVKWYRIAAARQDEWAQTRLGSIYAEGKSVPQDFQEAVKWYRLAAAQGYAPAQSSLGLAYENEKACAGLSGSREVVPPRGSAGKPNWKLILV